MSALTFGGDPPHGLARWRVSGDRDEERLARDRHERRVGHGSDGCCARDVIDQRDLTEASISEFAHTLSDEQWDHDGLCDGWRVRDVIIHSKVVLDELTGDGVATLRDRLDP